MLTILQTNDFHGALDARRQERLAALRDDADLYFDCGDAIKAGNLAIPLRSEEVWRRLVDLRCSASVLGNRESHVLESAFAKKLEGSGHPVLCANLRRKDGSRPLPGHLVLSVASLRVGVIGVMVPMVTDRMATRGASAFLWDPPVSAAIREAETLRPDVDCLIALTHIGLRQDRDLAAQTRHFDLILGGHSHDVLSSPVVVEGTPIGQAGSHGRYVARYCWSREAGLESYELISLG